MRKPEELSDANSRFRKCCGVTAHYKCFGPKAGQAPTCAMACYHGFGANLWSWERTHKLVAEAVRGVVTAHDMPGFGLTERCRKQSAYSLLTNGNIGRELLVHELSNFQGVLEWSANVVQPRCCILPSCDAACGVHAA
jgi:pimeloyl-ACP methyl ester carboxylesterase